MRLLSSRLPATEHRRHQSAASPGAGRGGVADRTAGPSQEAPRQRSRRDHQQRGFRRPRRSNYAHRRSRQPGDPLPGAKPSQVHRRRVPPRRQLYARTPACLRAAIWEVDPQTGAHRVFASGMRNPNGMAWVPAQAGSAPVLWTVVNERDELGSDLVPDYMTSVRDGGFPPLMLDPVDFVGLYRQNMERQAAAQGAQAKPS